ncbi:Protein LATE ELONGATED HYPOCOTYL [Linum grandiflorum]
MVPEAMQNCPRHVPVHILDDSTVPVEESQARSDVYSLPTAEFQTNMASSSTNQSFPSFPHPFAPTLHNQDDYRSFLQMSSTFSSLIASTLLQNPAAHAAASYAASFWPYANVDSSACTSGGFSSRPVNNASAPSMAAIAAATVAAATAWWAAHGLLPMCAPQHTTFTCPPPPEVPSGHTEKMETKEGDLERMDHKDSEAAQAHNSPESGENGVANPNKVADHEMNATTAPEVHDCSEAKKKKQVDRSSCGSNTASSSEVETDALEKNGNKGNEETKEADANLPASSDPGTRRIIRSNGGMGDSWKSVSQVGRMAFQALFSREKLPQSFSPPQNGEMQNVDERNNGEATIIDLNNEAWCHNQPEDNNVNNEECLPKIGIENGKLKARRTGFKPYKRCSMEAKEDMLTTCSCSGQGDEKESKRIRLALEGEASI